MEPYGCVLIDEVDLHLHPSLALEVIKRFRNLFPKMQYIMTTHSPLAITNLPHENGDNKILRMVKGESKPHVLPDVYGIDYDVAVRDGSRELYGRGCPLFVFLHTESLKVE